MLGYTTYFFDFKAVFLLNHFILTWVPTRRNVKRLDLSFKKKDC